MASQRQLDILQQGTRVWNDWRRDNPKVVPDLSDANLAEADLSGAYLNDVNLSRADLSGVNLSSAHLVRATLKKTNLKRAHLSGTFMNSIDLSYADLRGAELWIADLRFADLHGARLSGADLSASSFIVANIKGADMQRTKLSWVDFHGADLSKANLKHALMDFTILANIDLRGVRGLESVFHLGPSSIGLDTIYLSRGEIPVAFLRGAGVPDNFIDYMPSLVNKPYDFYSCFISYSTSDQEFAERLHADLQDKGVRCWFAPHDVQAGKKLHEQIDQAIRLHQRLLLILSTQSMHSEWVKTEISKARERERTEKRPVLFPIRLVDFSALQQWQCFDADSGKDAAKEIREYFIPDFSDWKNHDSYRKAFNLLLRDLRGAGSHTK